MKLRKGFVTNSSSSSFIIGYNNLTELKEDLTKECYAELKNGGCYDFPHASKGELKKHIEKIIERHIKEGKVTKKDFHKNVDIIEELLDKNSYFSCTFRGKQLWYYKSSEISNENTEVGKFVRGLIGKELDKIYLEIAKYKHILYLEVEDHTDVDYTLERYVLPSYKGKIAMFSHH